ncbi:uncharacterized protein Z518_04616 [Rhinocladiella mackenziei CBS 650.93]|uniref:2,4-diaminopentanoate dehydrogenase C-terminal domain-containing protein n=1 Tax=Rhinocladiella mackenziei CBS 650.93 TaxID=1442369 RepID=A0A0D2JC18_9EURO|nr:uncharacterized protein Z518_04616 [Rhinocladiella mackenziei CBS 650.93]KIX06640.1 hypothetical protein Z518_04616 [Rhinocladiella mackenziei CBS 650.93]
MPEKIRVVHCGTGPTGRVTLRALLNHPDLELVGLLVFSAQKDGVDAGQVCQLDRDLGVKATRDVDALIAAKPDVVTYVGNGNEAESSVKLAIRFLEAGINVSTPCLFWMVEPSTVRQKNAGATTTDGKYVDMIEAACVKGKSTCFLTGSDPGFFSPFLTIAMLKGADEVNEIRMQELGNYAFHDVPWLPDVFGFGRPKEFQSVMKQGTFVKHAWGGTINAVAKALKIELEDIRFFFENATHDKTHTTLWGTIEAGTVAAVRVGLEGIYRGKPFVILEHITRTCMEAAPFWPQAHGGDLDKSKLRHEYTILIKGDPDYDCRIAMGESRAGEDAGLYNTGALVVNAIPAVVKAQPGVLNDTDIPMEVTRNIRV